MRAMFCALLVSALVACATSQGKFRPIGQSYPAKPADFVVEVFETAPPTRPFERIARLDAHFEKTTLIPTTHAAGLAELKKQARVAGADAIVEIREQRSRVGETLILHVTATGIRYVAQQ